MAVPRAHIVDPNEPGLYHCFSRCVRRAFLMGPGHDHRRAWIERRLEFLCSVFAVDAAAHSAMSNHLHVLVRIDPPRARDWTAHEVVRRWGCLHPKSVLARAGLAVKRGARAPDELPDEAIARVARDDRRVEEYRRRLSSLSWFMKSLKEPLARLANAEDGVSGAFWEGRFRSPRVLDLAGLLTCMVYIDLNPIHAGLCEGLADSMYTSVRLRLKALRRFLRSRALRMTLPAEDIARLERIVEQDEATVETPESSWMAPVGGGGDGARTPLLGIDAADYIAIVETAGRRPDPRKRGMIPARVMSVLESLRMDVDRWLTVVTGKDGPQWGTAIGSAISLAVEAARRGVKRVVGALEVCLAR